MSRDFLLQQLKAAGVSLTEASVKIGRNASYLQQFVKRGTPVELRERERRQLALLLGVDENALREPPGAQWSMTLPGNIRQDPTVQGGAAVVQNKEPAALSQRQNNSIDSHRSASLLSYDLPVYGTSSPQGLDGLFVITDHPVDRMPRTDFLVNVDDAYSLIVPDDRMSPEAHTGDTIVMSPHLPCRKGDTCLFRKNRNGDEGVIGYLVNSSLKSWSVCQHAMPKKIIELDKVIFPIADPLVAKYYRYRK